MATHEALWAICRDQERYLSGCEDPSQRDHPDCSCGCRWFHPLEGKEGMDWGVCTHPKSPRAGLLTFEHMGCAYFDAAVDAAFMDHR